MYLFVFYTINHSFQGLGNTAEPTKQQKTTEQNNELKYKNKWRN